MTAGSSLQISYNAIERIFPVSHVVVVSDEDVYRDNENDDDKKSIINNIESLKVTLKDRNIVYDEILLCTNSLEELEEKVSAKLLHATPETSLYFNITGGRRPLAFRLFMIANWLKGVTYYVYGNTKKVELLHTPKLNIDDLLKNRYYEEILKAVVANDGEIEYVCLFERIGNEYEPLRDKDRADKLLSRGTLTKWKEDLIRWGLITEEYREGNKKYKQIKITDEGMFVLKMLPLIKRRS